MSENQVEVLVPPVKSEGDKKEYRLIKLQNGLKALLIRNFDESSKDELPAAACLNVGVGSFDEPKNIGGLGHFLEHMLFMGSEKYPEESGFNNFISLHGGQRNAETDHEHTAYYFKISENAFPEALDRLAQFFISPLLLKDALHREREAVDSEFLMAQSQEIARLLAFIKSRINDDHFASFFDYGNLKTLKDDLTDDELYDAVREFFKKYVANNMWLSVQSNKTLDELQQLVVDKFSAIKSGEIVVKPKQSIEEILKPEFHEKMHFIKPLKDTQSLRITWFIDSVEKHFKCRPIGYFEAIFENQGEGTLSSYLKDQNLASTMYLLTSAQGFLANSAFAMMILMIDLTYFGLENVDKVLEATFAYLLMIKETPIEEHRRLFNDHNEGNKLEFKFHSESGSIANVSNACIGMKYFDDVNIIRSHSFALEFDEKVITSIINAVNERKFNLNILNGKHEKFELKEKYFGVEYDEQDFPESYQKLWDDRQLKPEFFLEKPNPFKATNFEIFVNDEESTKFPIKILESDKIDVWHKLDSKFKLPKAFVYVNIISPDQMKSAHNAVIMDLYEKLLRFNFEKRTFSAPSAGLEVVISVEPKGLEIKFRGYNEKIKILIEMISKDLRRLPEDITEEMFELQKTEMKKSLFNALATIASVNYDLTAKTLKNEYWTVFDKYNEIDKISFETLQKFLEKFYRQSKMQVLIQGNMLRAEADEIVKVLESELANEPLDTDYKVKGQSYQLPLGTHVLRAQSRMIDDDNSTIGYFYQVGPLSIRNECLLKLLEAILKPHAFDYLRSKEQLGYSVGVHGTSYSSVLGLNVFVSSQESKNSYAKVCEKLNVFMKEVATKAIDELPDEDFENVKQAKINLLERDDLKISYEIDENWSEIQRFDFMFNRDDVASAVTKTLTKLEVQEFFKTFTQPENMRRLSIQVIGHKKKEGDKDHEMTYEFMSEKLTEDEIVITNIEDFQKNLMLYPVIDTTV